MAVGVPFLILLRPTLSLSLLFASCYRVFRFRKQEGSLSSAHSIQSGDRLLRLRDVKTKTGLGSSTIYRYIQAGTFPAPVKIGGFTARWRESQVEAWIDALPRLRPDTTSSSGI